MFSLEIFGGCPLEVAYKSQLLSSIYIIFHIISSLMQIISLQVVSEHDHRGKIFFSTLGQFWEEHNFQILEIFFNIFKGFFKTILNNL